MEEEEEDVDGPLPAITGGIRERVLVGAERGVEAVKKRRRNHESEWVKMET
jgi:hypothetical protein